LIYGMDLSIKPAGCCHRQKQKDYDKGQGYRLVV